MAVLSTALLSAACSRGGTGEAGPRLVERWRVSSITPIGQGVIAGDTVIVYGRVNQDLYLYGVLVADGTIRWRQPASPSATTSGIALAPKVIDGRIAYFRPDPTADLAARLVIAEPSSGRDLLVSGPAHFGSQPAHCADGRDVCVMTRDGAATTSRRFSLEAGGPVADRGAPPPDSRLIGEDLLDLGQRQPEVLAGFHDGTVTWRSPLARHFSNGYTTDRGWYFELYRAAGLHVGSVGHPSDRNDPSVVVVDLAKVETAAIDAATGASVWRSTGTRFACNATIALERPVGRTIGGLARPLPLPGYRPVPPGRDDCDV